MDKVRHLKKAITILLCVGILAQVCSAVLVYYAFCMNEDYIATSLCVNRNAPQAHCHGHCYLQKQMKQQEAQKSRPAGQHKNTLTLPLFCHDAKRSLQPCENAVYGYSARYVVAPYSAPQGSCFHPPADHLG